MSRPAIAVTDEQLRDAHRAVNQAVSYEVMRANPALLICLRNIAEIRARKRPARPAFVDLKRLASNDRD